MKLARASKKVVVTGSIDDTLYAKMKRLNKKDGARFPGTSSIINTALKEFFEKRECKDKK